MLAYFSILFLMVAYVSPPELIPLIPLLVGMGVAYAVGFAGIVALWFWARWYAMGLGFSGVVLAGLVTFELGELVPVILFFGAAHVAVCLALMGDGAASAYDGRRDWRERFRLDENGVNRLGKAVMRAGASLPYLILAGLAPKQGLGWVVGALALVAGVAGLRGLVRLRTWGLVSLAAAAAAALAVPPTSVAVAPQVWVYPWVGALLCAAAVAPFLPAMVSALRAPR